MKYKKRDNLYIEKGCPHCRGDLIIKKGKYGDFLSCHRYPMCKYSQNLVEPFYLKTYKENIN